MGKNEALDAQIAPVLISALDQKAQTARELLPVVKANSRFGNVEKADINRVLHNSGYFSRQADQQWVLSTEGLKVVAQYRQQHGTGSASPVPTHQSFPTMPTTPTIPTMPKKRPVIVVAIDLCNVHDCLQQVERYTMIPNTQVIPCPYSDQHANPYGVNPRHPALVQQATDIKGAYVTRMIWDIARFDQRAPDGSIILVASHSKLLKEMELIDKKCKVQYATNWTELQPLLEAAIDSVGSS